jgi:hypothetical protein
MAPWSVALTDRKLPRLRRAWRVWAPTSVTAVCYAALLAGAELSLSTRSTPTRVAWMSWASTNIDNLQSHPLRVLVASAFLTEDHPLAWVALALIGLTTAGRVLGNGRTALVVALAHLLATAVSEGLVAYRISVGAEPVSDRLLVDVGPSYVVVSALAAAIAWGTWPGRVAAAIGFVAVAPYLFGGLLHGDVWALGHASAVVVGLVLGWPLRRAWSRGGTRPR